MDRLDICVIKRDAVATSKYEMRLFLGNVRQWIKSVRLNRVEVNVAENTSILTYLLPCFKRVTPTISVSEGVRD